MITVYTFSFNESNIIQFRTKFIKDRFPNCKLILFDNQSTDDTVFKAEKLGYEIIHWNTGGRMKDGELRELKNNCWKDAKTDWVMVSDMDELLDIDEDDLKREEEKGVTIIKGYHHEIINKENVGKFEDLMFAKLYSKVAKRVLFNRKYIININFEIGAHAITPEGKLVFSKVYYPFLHYRWLSLPETIVRYKLIAPRLSRENLMYKWSHHYKFSKRKIIKHWNTLIKECIKFK